MTDPGPKCRNCGTHAADHLAFGKCPTPEGAPANWTRHTFEPISEWPMRRSPDGRDLAICNRLDAYFPWRVTDGSQRSDRQVADWEPVLPAIDPPGLEAGREVGGLTDTYVPPGVVAVLAPGTTAWTADEGGFFVRRDPSALPAEEDVLARIERWLYRTYGDDDERGVPALAEELLHVVDGTAPEEGE